MCIRGVGNHLLSLTACSPVAWVVTSEIFPLEVRAAAVSITTAANWAGNFVVAMLTPVLIASPLKIYGTFYLLSGALVAGLLFVLLTLPETKVSVLEVSKASHNQCCTWFHTGIESGKN